MNITNEQIMELIESYVDKRITLGTPKYNVVSARARQAIVDALSPQPEAGAEPAEPDALPREEFASLVVQEACETDPADEDDPECIRILRNDLKSAVLAAFMRNRKTKPAESVLKESIEWLTDYCKRPSPGEEHLPHLRILLAAQVRKDGK